MIIPTTGLNSDKAKVIGQFALYFACEGQQKAAVLGYSPLPKNLVEAVFSAISALQGADAPPELTAKNCANPSLSGDLGTGANDAGTSTGATAGSGSTSGGGTSGGTSGGGTSGGTTGGGTSGGNSGGSTGSGTSGGTTGGDTSGGTTVIDNTKYSAMQPMQVTVTTSGFASPTLIGFGLLGIVLLPMSIRLIGPPIYRLAHRLISRMSLSTLWTYRRKTQKH
jgi:hypothetical protein